MNNGFDLRGATMAGIFDIRLDWSRGDLPSALAPPPQPGAAPVPDPDPSEVIAGISASLQKLGLKPEPAQGPGEFLVIDRVEKPNEN